MKVRNCVIAALLVAFCVEYSSSSQGGQARRAFRSRILQAPPAYRTRILQAPYAYGCSTKAYTQTPNAFGGCEPSPRGTPCGDNGLYSDGMGTCCSPIQTNPPSCQPPPAR